MVLITGCQSFFKSNILHDIEVSISLTCDLLRIAEQE